MKKTPFSNFLAILLSLVLLSCSKEDNEIENILNVEGTVKGIVTCNTEERGAAYGIIPEDFEVPSGFLITATLPNEFKQEGLKIKFDMKPSKRYIMVCTSNFYPEQFYEVFNATILTNQQ